MKTILQIVFGAVAVALAYLFIDSMLEPIRFRDAVEYRRNLVIQRLKDIRDLEIAYKDRYGRFSGSFDTLISFYKLDSLKIIKQVGSWDDSAAVAKKLVFTDTIKIAVKDTLFKRREKFSIDSVRRVPLVNSDFDIAAVMYPSISGVEIPLFEAKTDNRIYLGGLDIQAIVNLTDEQQNMNKYPGLKVGSITQPNNNTGNWE
ncbi:MAG: hypothetical protein LBG92_01430 [Prevotellaceae bacterium]|jgi:hypothetical protein|nr:hypothetical protein [Prevotellaceae bacterium]